MLLYHGCVHRRYHIERCHNTNLRRSHVTASEIIWGLLVTISKNVVQTGADNLDYLTLKFCTTIDKWSTSISEDFRCKEVTRWWSVRTHLIGCRAWRGGRWLGGAWLLLADGGKALQVRFTKLIELLNKNLSNALFKCLNINFYGVKFFFKYNFSLAFQLKTINKTLSIQVHWIHCTVLVSRFR